MHTARERLDMLWRRLAATERERSSVSPTMRLSWPLMLLMMMPWRGTSPRSCAAAMRRPSGCTGPPALVFRRDFAQREDDDLRLVDRGARLLIADGHRGRRGGACAMKPSKAKTFRRKPCPHGHGPLRFASTRKCVRCSRLKYLRENKHRRRIGARKTGDRQRQELLPGQGVYPRAHAATAVRARLFVPPMHCVALFALERREAGASSRPATVRLQGRDAGAARLAGTRHPALRGGSLWV